MGRKLRCPREKLCRVFECTGDGPVYLLRDGECVYMVAFGEVLAAASLAEDFACSGDDAEILDSVAEAVTGEPCAGRG